MRVNNVDLEKVGRFVAEVENDKSKAIKVKKVEGAWSLNDSGPQFSAIVKHGESTTTIEADSPEFLGGNAKKPDPVQYCLFGLAACYAQTFASIAAEKGIKLASLNVSAENKVNLSKPLGLGNEPVVESVKITVSASTADAADIESLKPIEDEARERCPGVYCLTHPIKLETELKTQK